MVSQSLAILADEVHEALKVTPFANNDETSHYCKHKLNWLWVMGNDRLTYFAIQNKRDTTAAQHILGNEVTDIRIADHYNAYNFIPKKFRQHCWLHLKRDIKAVADNDDSQQSIIGEQLEVSRKAIFLTVNCYKEANEAKKTYYKNTIFQHMKAFRHALREGVQLEKNSYRRILSKSHPRLAMPLAFSTTSGCGADE